MQFRITKEELTRALGRVQGIVEKRSTNPIIANVLMEVSDGGLVVSATDTEVAFVGRYAAECQRPGRVTLGARQLYEIARLLPTEQVQFTLPEGSLQMEIQSGRAFFKVLGLAAEEFPPLPDLAADGGLDLEASALQDLVDKTLYAVSSDDTRTGLNGAHVEARDLPGGERVLRFVATDGHRLSLCGRPFGGQWTAARPALLPKKGLSELRKLLEDGEGSLRVSFSDTLATFRRGNIAFSMRLLEGEFPDYEQVVPASWQRRVLVQRDALTQALKRVSILASEKSHPVRFVLKAGAVTITARQPETGEAREEIEAQVEGSDIEVGFNARYFLDALGSLHTETVAVEIGDSLSPCIARPGEGGGDELYVIMPMRLE